MNSRPVAFVDETYIQVRGHPGIYLLAAVLAERADVADLEAAARIAARGFAYHSTQLHHHGHVGVIEDMLDVVATQAAWSAIVATTPITAGNEIARQHSMQRLLTYLNQQKVSDVVLDVRGDQRQWQDAHERGMKMPEPNYRDLRTYRHMVRGGEISSRMRLTHVNDRDQPGLWLADAVAWAARRALAVDEPQWWNRIADAATVLDSVTGRELLIESDGAALPDGERGPHERAQWDAAIPAQPMLSPLSYGEPGAVGHSLSVGVYLSHLLDQVRMVRSPTAAIPSEVTRELLATVRALAADVAELREAIDHGTRTAPGTRPRSEPLAGDPVVTEHRGIDADGPAELDVD